VLQPSKQAHRWSIQYRPPAADDRGEIHVKIDGKDSCLTLDSGSRAQGAMFDCFGLFNIQAGGWHVELYLDDLTDTAAGSNSSGKN